MKKFLLSMLLILVVNKILAAVPQPKIMVVQSNAPVLTVTLPANPSTGFSWFLQKYDHHLLIIQSRKMCAVQRNKPGMPSCEIWKFSVKKEAFVVPRVTQIHWWYLRPWEEESKQPWVLTVVIRGNH